MKWRKTGRIYTPEARDGWRVSHAQIPLVDRVSDEVLRIYFGTRDASNRTVTTYIEVRAHDPREVLYEHDAPVLGLGELGCFDDAGSMPSWIVDHDGRKYLYYIGWNTSVSVPYRNAIGLAVSDDGGRTFRRCFRGPIVDRTRHEPHFCGASCVLVEDGLWRMWYQPCIRWVVQDGRPEPVYHIRYAESDDGAEWRRLGVICIELALPDEGGITRPCVIAGPDGYRMWYCYRGVRDYRMNPAHSYRIGYAESADGVRWTRMDERVGIDVSTEGWDSEMVAYAHVYEHAGRLHMIYNGNGFGRSGFGHAVEDD